MLIYAVTVVLSACLLFLIQPLITKLIFPWFGGAATVWIVALMFFQVCLLCGYAYAHWLTTKLSMHRQRLVHTALLIASCLLLPITPTDAWKPSSAAQPVLQIITLLAANIGLPCLVLSATSPLLQAWYVRERGSSIPLWLFSLSNFGSLAALLSFPFVLEPNFDVRTMTTAWSLCFATFAALCIVVSWRTRTEHESSPPVSDGKRTPDALEMTIWIALAACASGLLGAATVQLSINVAPIPLLWVVPLAIYLLTFILSFSSQRLYNRKAYFPFVGASIAAIAWLYAHSEVYQEISYVIPVYLICLFILCMACHGELALRAPSSRYLTRFYLLIALGGALGGIFVSAIAPFAFETYLELPILLVVLAELMIAVQWKRRGAALLLYPFRGAMLAALAVLLGGLAFSETRSRELNISMHRTFYGVLLVREYSELGRQRRSLVHGTIRHGYQLTDPADGDLATSYYSPASGVGRVIRMKQSQGPARIGVVGLGVGTLVSYARAGDEFGVYEINDEVLAIARDPFTYLTRAEARGAHVRVALGDARLTLEREEAQQFDVLAIDAFSSDAIPVHLLTHEAFSVYLRHLKPDGVLAVHISNRYLDLEPVCERAASEMQRSARLIHTPAGETVDASDWVLISANTHLWSHPVFAGADVRVLHARAGFRGWTDRYSSLWPLVKLGAPQAAHP